MYHGVARQMASTITGTFESPVLFSQPSLGSPRDPRRPLMRPLLKSKSMMNTRPTATVAVTFGRNRTRR